MLLVEYLNSQFSLMQNLDFFIRILVACLCGAVIGAERSKRFKEAGVRTHMIVCCGAALMMIVSKYSFADLTSAAGVNFSGVRGADSARIAAQVVSGISFLAPALLPSVYFTTFAAVWQEKGGRKSFPVSGGAGRWERGGRENPGRMGTEKDGMEERPSRLRRSKKRQSSFCRKGG